MNKIKSLVLILAMLSVTIAIVLISFRNEDSDAVIEKLQKVQSSQSSIKPVEQAQEQLEAEQVSSPQSQSLSTPVAHSEVGRGPNSAARFFDLPMEQQQEILELSGRNSDSEEDYDIQEVEPGVFSVLKKNGPRVVPVAVMNDDGTVSIHEY